MVCILCYTICMMKHTLKRRTIHITTLQEQALKKVSELSGYSVAEIIRRAIDEYIERRYADVSHYTDKPTR